MLCEVTHDLSPVQQRAFYALLGTTTFSSIIQCICPSGRGRSTVLSRLHRELGGKLLTIKDFVEAAGGHHPLALEDAVYKVLLAALKEYEVVLVDDLHLAVDVMGSRCGSSYPRAGWIEAPLAVIAAYAIDTGKRLIVAGRSSIADSLDAAGYTYGISRFEAEDYRFLGCAFLGAEQAAPLDFEKIHRFAPRLNAHQLQSACRWLRQFERLTTEEFIEHLHAKELTSNVALGEVAEVDLRDLYGVEDVLRSLEANIVLPLENDALATELSLRPKRGVLLVGPPGTGKTTIGRALAHRLKGKFFLIDGTMISGTGEFYSTVHGVFRYAQQNAPSVIFIDDSDVIFESGQEHGLYRYLLTMLDGLESQSAGQVCVMMTAMDVGNLPPALVRSGRIELWLEMRLPDQAARASILEHHLRSCRPPLCNAQVPQLAGATEGFTGADLRRLVEDGKVLYAYDRVRGKELQETTAYFLTAVETVRSSKSKYAEAEARANARRPSRPAWFSSFADAASDEADGDDEDDE